MSSIAFTEYVTVDGPCDILPIVTELVSKSDPTKGLDIHIKYNGILTDALDQLVSVHKVFPKVCMIGNTVSILVIRGHQWFKNVSIQIGRGTIGLTKLKTMAEYVSYTSIATYNIGEFTADENASRYSKQCARVFELYAGNAMPCGQLVKDVAKIKHDSIVQIRKYILSANCLHSMIGERGFPVISADASFQSYQCHPVNEDYLYIVDILGFNPMYNQDRMLIYGFELKCLDIEHSVVAYLPVVWKKCPELANMLHEVFVLCFSDFCPNRRMSKEAVEAFMTELCSVFGQKHVASASIYAPLFTSKEDAKAFSDIHGTDVMHLCANVYTVVDVDKGFMPMQLAIDGLVRTQLIGMILAQNMMNERIMSTLRVLAVGNDSIYVDKGGFRTTDFMKNTPGELQIKTCRFVPTCEISRHTTDKSMVFQNDTVVFKQKCNDIIGRCIYRRPGREMIQQAPATRCPTVYNLWIREKMAELRSNGMTPKERFAECIRTWNDNKKRLAEAAAA